MKSVVFRESARTELNEARDWLNRQREHAGEALFAEAGRLTLLISGTPEAFAIVISPDVRRVVVGDSDYLMFYRDEPAAVVVLAFIHGRRRPAAITRRVNRESRKS